MTCGFSSSGGATVGCNRSGSSGSSPEIEVVPGAIEHAVPVKPIPQFLASWQELEQKAENKKKQTLIFVGGGAAKFQTVCQHANAEFLTEVQPSARVMAATAQGKFDAGQFEDVAYFEPYYLKDFMPG